MEKTTKSFREFRLGFEILPFLFQWCLEAFLEWHIVYYSLALPDELSALFVYLHRSQQALYKFYYIEKDLD